MKIGVITLFYPYAWDNYGGTLQNYALVNYLNQLGYEAYTIAPIHRMTRFLAYDKCSRALYHHFGLRLERSGKLLIPKYIGVQKERNDAFKQFVKRNVPIKYYWMESDESYDKIESEYDAFIVGSDQVWNTYFALDENTYKDYLLAFAPSHKRFAYAASFGTANINSEWESRLKAELSQFKSISVREFTGKSIVQGLIGVMPEEVIDPTLLISADEWGTIAQKPDFLDETEKYMVTYFLAGNEEAREDIETIAREGNLKIYNLFNRENEDIFKLGPSQFLYMIKHARIVVTDSFHACVFSFLFEKPFLVYERNGENNAENMGSRIESFLSKFCLQRKRVGNLRLEELLECDYTEGKMVLAKEKKRAKEYLLKINNDKK